MLKWLFSIPFVVCMGKKPPRRLVACASSRTSVVEHVFWTVYEIKCIMLSMDV